MLLFSVHVGRMVVTKRHGYYSLQTHFFTLVYSIISSAILSEDLK